MNEMDKMLLEKDNLLKENDDLLQQKDPFIRVLVKQLNDFYKETDTAAILSFFYKLFRLVFVQAVVTCIYSCYNYSYRIYIYNYVYEFLCSSTDSTVALLPCFWFALWTQDTEYEDEENATSSA